MKKRVKLWLENWSKRTASFFFSSHIPNSNSDIERTDNWSCAVISTTASSSRESLIPYELLLSFLSLPMIVVILVFRSTFPYLLFLQHFLQFPVIPVLSRTSPSKILLSMPALFHSSVFEAYTFRIENYYKWWLDLSQRHFAVTFLGVYRSVTWLSAKGLSHRTHFS